MSDPTTTAQRWRASLAPLDKPTDDGRTLTMTAEGAWGLGERGRVGLYPEWRHDTGQPTPEPCGTVDRLAVEDGRIIAYGQVWDQATAEGMFSGRLRPEAGWRVPNEAMVAEADRIVMSGGSLGYVKASSGPSPWPDENDTWFAEDQTARDEATS